MLSIASSQLRTAVDVTQKAQNGARFTKSRSYSTDAPKGGAGKGNSSGGDSSKRKKSAYTYKQAYEQTQRGEQEPTERKQGSRYQNLEERRAWSEKRFQGVKVGEGSAKNEQSRGFGRNDKSGMPEEKEPMRRSASEVKTAREKTNQSGRFSGMRASASAAQPTASVTAGLRGRTVDKEGDDKLFSSAGSSSRGDTGSYGGSEGGERSRPYDRDGASRRSDGDGGRERGSYGGASRGGSYGESRGGPRGESHGESHGDSSQSSGGSGGGRRDWKRKGDNNNSRFGGAQSSTVAKSSEPQLNSTSGAASANHASKKKRTTSPTGGAFNKKNGGGSVPTGAEEDDFASLNRPADLTGSRLVGLVDSNSSNNGGLSAAKAARLAELERLSDNDDGESALEAATFAAARIRNNAKHIDQDLDGDEVGEERLIDELTDGDAAAEGHTIDEETARFHLLASQQASEDFAVERNLVNQLPKIDAKKKEASFDDRDPALRRLIEADVSHSFSNEDIYEADHRDEILDPETLTTKAEMEGEQILMTTQFSFGTGANEISLHSEKGLLYGVVDMFDRMVTEKKRHLLVKAKKQKRFEIWKAVSWKLREKKRKLRRERQIKQRIEARERFFKFQEDPEMCYYPELNLWFSKEELRQDIFRNAISAALINPTWSRSRRRDFMLGVKKDLEKLATPLSEKKQKHLDAIFQVPKPAPVSDLRTVEHLLPLPTTDWSLLMAQAERAMDPADRARRFDLSPFEKSGKL